MNTLINAKSVLRELTAWDRALNLQQLRSRLAALADVVVRDIQYRDAHRAADQAFDPRSVAEILRDRGIEIDFGHDTHLAPIPPHYAKTAIPVSPPFIPRENKIKIACNLIDELLEATLDVHHRSTLNMIKRDIEQIDSEQSRKQFAYAQMKRREISGNAP